ncbi:MAG: DNA-processing protein DprA [Alphaproteobacteria bacterium]
MIFSRFQMNDEQRLNWLRLIRSDNIGVITFFELLQRFGSAENALDAIPKISKISTKNFKICSREKAQEEIDYLDKIKAKIITLCDPEYPPLLAEIADPPPIIIAKGNFDILTKKSVAIVGARNASISGKKLAYETAVGLVSSDITVVSGMARGIDTAAHEGALSSKGATIAVLGTGVDVVYPYENTKLYHQLCSEGVVISEFPCKTSPQPQNFPRRNRIISGISEAVAVIEASLKSGSLITARTALEQNREIFAIPGSPKDPRAGGPNSLIRNGANLLESYEDIIKVLADRNFVNYENRKIIKQKEQTSFDFCKKDDYFEKPIQNINETRETIINMIGKAPVCIDDIIRVCSLSNSEISMILLELELEGKLERHIGNRVSLID